VYYHQHIDLKKISTALLKHCQ